MRNMAIVLGRGWAVKLEMEDWIPISTTPAHQAPQRREKKQRGCEEGRKASRPMNKTSAAQILMCNITYKSSPSLIYIRYTLLFYVRLRDFYIIRPQILSVRASPVLGYLAFFPNCVILVSVFVTGKT